MLEYDVEALSASGLTPALAELVAVLPATTDTTLHLTRVTEVHRESVTVHDGRSERAARLDDRLSLLARDGRVSRRKFAPRCGRTASVARHLLAG